MACLHTAERQFNDILIVNESLIFRFPRSPHVAVTLAAEAALLTQLQERLPLPIPQPNYHMRARPPPTAWPRTRGRWPACAADIDVFVDRARAADALRVAMAGADNQLSTGDFAKAALTTRPSPAG